MSFILDALRRAESGPTPAPQASAPIVVDTVQGAPVDMLKGVKLIGGALIVLVLAVAFAWWLGRDNVPPPPAAAVALDAAPAQSPPPVTAPPPQPAPSLPARREPVRSLDREAARAQVRSAPPATPPAPATSASALPPPGTRGTVTVMPAPGSARPAAAAASETPEFDPSDALPKYENLLTEARMQLPDLNMDMHVYNRTPAKRFVFVNLRKYREGDALDARTRIEEITPKGAVLNYNGQRFLLRPN